MQNRIPWWVLMALGFTLLAVGATWAIAAVTVCR
jgi:hypothetical protein